MTIAKIKRYNIYSCMSIDINQKQLCFDPAKIRACDINNLNPDYIFISHESMDHMDPAQVYTLQKRKNCPIFCSFAAAVDLMQFFPYDSELLHNIHVMLPGSRMTYDNLVIETEKSIHCDYMFPVVFKISLINENISILHCFDTLISEGIINFSNGTDLAIIPIGIAKGVSSSTGIEFVEKLHSKKFLTNHLKTSQDLKKFENVYHSKKPCYFIDWNESCEVCFETANDYKSYTVQDNVLSIISNFNSSKFSLYSDSMFKSYKDLNTKDKTNLIVLYTLVAIFDSKLIKKDIINEIVHDLSLSTNENNNIGTVILLFLSVYSQQHATTVITPNHIVKLVNKSSEHLTYWVVQYFGRCIVADKDNPDILTAFLDVIDIPDIYNSVIVRRQIFWEFLRVMKTIPSATMHFSKYFDDGLEDSNPDVRLLALLCFSLADRFTAITDSQLDKIFELLKDDEDDVRETAVKVARSLTNTTYILKHKEQLFALLDDANCHVKHEAHLIKSKIDRLIAND